MRSKEQDVRGGAKTITLTVNSDGTIRHGSDDQIIVLKTATGGYNVYAAGFKYIKAASVSAFGNAGFAVSNVFQPNLISVACYNSAMTLTDDYFTLIISGIAK